MKQERSNQKSTSIPSMVNDLAAQKFSDIDARPIVRHPNDQNPTDVYMALPYRFEVYWDDGYWAAECLDLPGLVAGHEAWEGLDQAIADAKRAYFESSFESGIPIPLPTVQQDEFSGRLMVRLPKSLHRLAARRARREGVSLNALVMMARAKEVGSGAQPPATLPLPQFDGLAERPQLATVGTERGEQDDLAVTSPA